MAAGTSGPGGSTLYSSVSPQALSVSACAAVHESNPQSMPSVTHKHFARASWMKVSSMDDAPSSDANRLDNSRIRWLRCRPSVVILDESSSWNARRMGCRSLRRLRWFGHGAVQGVQLGLALDVVQRDLWAAAGPALERATVERRLGAFRRPHEAKRNGAAVPVRAYRQQGQAAAAAGDRTRSVSR